MTAACAFVLPPYHVPPQLAPAGACGATMMAGWRARTATVLNPCTARRSCARLSLPRSPLPCRKTTSG